MKNITNNNPEEKKCCELCSGNHSHFSGNARVDCPCHTPSIEKEEERKCNHIIKESEDGHCFYCEKCKEAHGTQELFISPDLVDKGKYCGWCDQYGSHQNACPDLVNKEEWWIKEFREYFDKVLKPKKPTIKNLDRELLVDFIRKVATQSKLQHNQDCGREELIKKIKKLTISNKNSYRMLKFKDGQEDMMSKVLSILTPSNDMGNLK